MVQVSVVMFAPFLECDRESQPIKPMEPMEPMGRPSASTIHLFRFL
jgi:hypothetical protein